MEKLRRPVRAAVLLILLAACLWIAWQVPYTHDDWDWGVAKGLRWWFSGEVNNRYCGSLFVIVMTRSQIIKTLVMGGTMLALPLLAAVIVSPRGSTNWFPLTILGCGVLMTMPMESWRQTYGWVSSFSNFVVGGLFLLVLILLVQRTVRTDSGAGGVLLAGLFLLTLATQLFSENLTAVLAAAAVLFALQAWRTGRNRPLALALLSGAVLGLILMFYSPLYSELATTGSAVNGVRQLAFLPGDGLIAILSAVSRRFFETVLPELFIYYPAVWVLVCAGAAWRAFRAGRSWLLILPPSLFSAVLLYWCWLKANYIHRGLAWDYPIPVLQFLGPPVVCVLVTLVLLTDPDRPLRLPRLSLLAGALALTGPFAILLVQGARCGFLSALLLVLLGMSLLYDFPWNALTTTLACLLLAAALVFHIRVYRVIAGCSALREQLIQEAVNQGSSRVILPTEDWKYFYFWERNPASAMRIPSYRTFYRLPEELELVFLPPGSYDVWPDVPQWMLDSGTIY